MKVSNVIFRRAAQKDIDSIAHYIAMDDTEAANQFFAALDDLCGLLMRMPNIGSMRIFQNPRLLLVCGVYRSENLKNIWCFIGFTAKI